MLVFRDWGSSINDVIFVDMILVSLTKYANLNNKCQQKRNVNISGILVSCIAEGDKICVI